MPTMAAGRHAGAGGVPPGWSEYLDFDTLRGIREGSGSAGVESKTWMERAADYKATSSGSFRKIKGESGSETLPPAEERFYTGTMYKKVIASRSSGMVPEFCGCGCGMFSRARESVRDSIRQCFRCLPCTESGFR